MWKAYVAILLTCTPTILWAAGLVPCGGAGEDSCQTCHVVLLINTVVTWLVGILGTIAAIMIVIHGLRLVTAAGDVSAKTEAKKKITNLLIGYAIVLAGWLFIDTGLKFLLQNDNYGVWNTVQCTTQPTAQAWSRTTASGDNVRNLEPEVVSSRVTAIQSSGSLQADIVAAAASAGITNQDQIDTFRALISQESGNCTNKIGPATGFGTAYGCGQLLVSTARALDPALATLSDEAVAAKLRDDNAYNLTLSAKYFDQLVDRYGNTDLALAAYNGGYAANQASSDCPGLRRWQCVWDSPGCYGTGRTDCDKNEGPSSYAQTRHYVSNINAIAERL